MKNRKTNFIPAYSPAARRILAGPVLSSLAAASFASSAFAGGPIDLPPLPLFAANEPKLGAASAAAPGSAELIPQAAPAPAPAAQPSVSVTVNLIRQLVDLGVLPKEKADGLLKQAEEEAAQVRAQYAAAQDAAVRDAINQTLAAVRANPALAPAPADPANPEVPPSPLDNPMAPFIPDPNATRITFIPEVVKAQLRDEIKRDIATSARAGELKVGRQAPEWVDRFRFNADVRIRGEGVAFGGGNDNTGTFPNFNSINTGQPFDTSGTVFSPQLNVDRNRQRVRLRARFGVEADLGEGFTAGMRFATGNTNTPTSTNQDLGLASGTQGGNFSKYAIWLDRAFVNYTLGSDPDRSATFSIGRFDNPFMSTEVIFDEDLGFDGFAARGRYRLGSRFTPFATAGIFPVFNSDLNFASNNPSKFRSSDKWLAAAQIGADWKLREKVNAKVAVAYYDFIGVEGKLSSPFVPLTASDAGDTDETRPSFAQKGNTYRALRNILATEENNYGTSLQYQYYGLATPFRNIVFSGKLDINVWEPVQVTLFGEYIQNVAFNRSAIDSIAVNNRGATSSGNGTGSFAGGNTAWIAGVKFGKTGMDKRGDWSAGLNYRYVESDAVVDGFNDSDFGLGGTNMRGFSLWASYALSSKVNVGVRWTSADEIAGPPLSTDIFQIDFNAKF